jgi:putative nucleotidyltransferase with HDIG domain
MLERRPVLIVDDDHLALQVLSETLAEAGWRTACFDDPLEALAAIGSTEPLVILSDHVMPGMDGVAFLNEARRRAPHASRVLCTASDDFDVALGAVNAGEVFRIVQKPWRPADLLRSVSDAAEVARLRQENERLARALGRQNELLRDVNVQLERRVRERTHSLLDGLVAALDFRDSETQWHSRRVSRFARRLAVELGVQGPELTVIEQAALLHDIGKIGIRDEVLRKPEALTDAEWEEMRRHAELGWTLLQRVDFLQPAADLVLQHHERWDGTGYPARIAGEQLALGARIFHVVDALDALMSSRPYRGARSYLEAREEIARCAGTHFDPRVVEAFLAIPAEDWERIRIDVETVAVLWTELTSHGPRLGAPAKTPGGTS